MPNGPYRKKRFHRGDPLMKKYKTKRKTKDLDEIDNDIKLENAEKLLNQEVDVDKPGNAQFYCLHCARYFIDDHSMKEHFRSKVHKRRLKALELEPYSIEESERAAGFGSFIQAKKRKIETQPPKEGETMKVDESLSSTKEQPNSSLFVSGKRATDTFIVVTPHLDFNERFNDITLLEENVKRRGLIVDVSRMKDLWNFYNDWNTNKIKLEENLEEIGKKLSKYIQMEDSEEKKVEMEKLQRYLHLVREDLTQVKKNVWDMEDSIIPELLKIPNNLHAESPEKEEELFSFHQENVSKGVDHLVLGKKLNCVEYRNGLTCFLKGKAALFELAVAEFFIDSFSNEDFIRFSNPDLMRSVLAEGVGLAPCDSSEVFFLEQTEGNNHLQLCGGASLFPFCALHAKHTVSKQALPIRYIAVGRQYTPRSNSLCGLYSVNQSTCVQIFTATFSEEEVDSEFQYCVNKVCEVYSTLGLNFKVVRQTPRSYKNWESLRASIRVFSPYHQDFLEVGSVSLIDDYVSKRLRMYYTDKTNEMFLKVVSGTVISTQTLLALCLERSNTDLFIPECVRNFLLV